MTRTIRRIAIWLPVLTLALSVAACGGDVATEDNEEGLDTRDTQGKGTATCNSLDAKSCSVRKDCELVETACGNCTQYGCRPCPKTCQPRKLACGQLDLKVCESRPECMLAAEDFCTQDCSSKGCVDTCTMKMVCLARPTPAICEKLDTKLCATRSDCTLAAQDFCTQDCSSKGCVTKCELKEVCITGPQKTCNPNVSLACGQGNKTVCAAASLKATGQCLPFAHGQTVGRGYACGGSIGVGCAAGLTCKGLPQQPGIGGGTGTCG